MPGPSTIRSTLDTLCSTLEKNRDTLLIALVVLETALVILALVPAQLWARLLPQSSSATLDGPFPPAIAPVITALIYLSPTFIGLISRNWQQALLYATLPAWIGLGLFLIAATFKIGAFYLLSTDHDHITASVSMLEMFIVLGGIGWLGRYVFKLQ
ncbi:MAG TPA: hypothetical protein VKV37_18730 [Ktedonobacteraceae bacterium]|jgi:hypothetical protein|nr:hypothetical protein [Ktedonobacteraceae bacterium]